MKQISISIAIFILISQAALSAPAFYFGADFDVGVLYYSEEVAGTNAGTQKNTWQNTNQRTKYNTDNLKWHATPLRPSIKPFVGITNRTERFFLEFAMPITFSAFAESPFQVKAIDPELLFNFAILDNKYIVQPYLAAGIGYAFALHKITEFEKRHQGVIISYGTGVFWNIKNTGFSFNTDVKLRVFVFTDVGISLTGGVGIKYTLGGRRTSKIEDKTYYANIAKKQQKNKFWKNKEGNRFVSTATGETYSINGGVWELPEKWFDEKGNLVYLKDSNYTESWYGYDSNGNRIYYKNTFGEEGKWDSNGKQLYLKDRNGTEIWYEYDVNGNKLYERTSDGKETWYEYNENGSTTYTILGNGTKIWEEYDAIGRKIHGKTSAGDEEWYVYSDSEKPYPLYYRDSNGVEQWIDAYGNTTSRKYINGNYYYY